MNNEALLEALNSGMNTTVHKIYLPVKGEEYSFKSLTVAQLKTLTKTLLTSEEKPFQIYESLCAMIKSLCHEDINMASMSEFDRMKIMFEILSTNDMISDFKINCTECGEENVLQLNSDKIISDLNEYKHKEIFFDNEADDRLTCKISIPTVRQMYGFYYLLQGEKIKSEDLFKIFINDIKISFSNKSVNDVELSHDDEEDSILQFIQNFELLPASLLKNKTTKESTDIHVSNMIDEMYSSQDLSGHCKKCGVEIGGEAPASNFI